MNYLPITDTYGNPVHSRTDFQPEPGSVVLTDGEWGTAWQRHFSDGKWYPTKGGPPRTWAYLCSRRNLGLVYAARKREDAPGDDSEARARAFLGMSAETLGLRPVED